MCNALSVSTGGYYNYLKFLDKPYKYESLLAEMNNIIEEDECNDTYGSMSLYEALKYKSSVSYECDFMSSYNWGQNERRATIS